MKKFWDIWRTPRRWRSIEVWNLWVEFEWGMGELIEGSVHGGSWRGWDINFIRNWDRNMKLRNCMMMSGTDQQPLALLKINHSAVFCISHFFVWIFLWICTDLTIFPTRQSKLACILCIWIWVWWLLMIFRYSLAPFEPNNWIARAIHYWKYGHSVDLKAWLRRSEQAYGRLTFLEAYQNTGRSLLACNIILLYIFVVIDSL